MIYESESVDFVILPLRVFLFSHWNHKTDCFLWLASKMFGVVGKWVALYILWEIKRKTGVKTQKSAFSSEEDVLNDTLYCKLRVFREEVFCDQGSVQISLEIKSVEGISRAYARAFQPSFRFLLSQVSHKSWKRERKVAKWSVGKGVFRWSMG